MKKRQIRLKANLSFLLLSLLFFLLPLKIKLFYYYPENLLGVNG